LTRGHAPAQLCCAVDGVLTCMECVLYLRSCSNLEYDQKLTAIDQDCLAVMAFFMCRDLPMMQCLASLNYLLKKAGCGLDSISAGACGVDKIRGRFIFAVLERTLEWIAEAWYA